MFSSGPILVPLDGSPLSERSLPYATALARAMKRKLALVIAAYVSDISERGPWSKEMVERPREVCLEYLTGVRDRFSLPDAELVVKVGYPRWMIPEAIEELDASMIVLSTHGRSGLSRWQYGSTAGHVVHDTKVPVFVIGKEVPERAAGDIALSSLLVPLDGSDLAEAALASAVELAGSLGATITLASAVPPAVEAFPYVAPSMFSDSPDDELLKQARQYLDEQIAVLPKGVSASAEVVVGHAAEALLAFVEERKIDLVVMSTHARAGVARAVLGSVADRVIQGTAPVLLLRPADQ